MTINYNDMHDDAFRQMVRDFVAQNCPTAMKHQARRMRWDEAREWCLTLANQGWSAPAWPVEHGGMGLNIDKLLAFQDEFDRAGVARHPDIGLVMMGPLLIQFGSPQQKAYYLPRIASFQDRWCQGYSEPGAGSDLASLRTSAVLDGDEWAINGHKIWTTLAQDATDIFVLARTDPNAKKQAGISFFLARMDTPGITVRPITTLTGEQEFCEVFFDNVRIPRDNIVGEVNDGWTMAKALLGHERLFHGSPKFAQIALFQLEAMAKKTGLMNDPLFLDRFAALAMDVDDLAATYARYAQKLRNGEKLGAEVSILKIWGTETTQRISELFVDAAQEHGVSLGGTIYDGVPADPLGHYYLSRPATIYGGSCEIQRNIIAKTVLNLP